MSRSGPKTGQGGPRLTANQRRLLVLLRDGWTVGDVGPSYASMIPPPGDLRDLTLVPSRTLAAVRSKLRRQAAAEQGG
jgi:hypothetical protein